MLIVWDKISHIFCWFRRIFAKFSKCGIFSNRCHLFNIFENNIPQNPNHVLLEKQMQNWKNFAKNHEKWHILWCWNFKELSSAEIWCDRQKKFWFLQAILIFVGLTKARERNCKSYWLVFSMLWYYNTWGFLDLPGSIARGRGKCFFVVSSKNQ